MGGVKRFPIPQRVEKDTGHIANAAWCSFIVAEATINCRSSLEAESSEHPERNRNRLWSWGALNESQGGAEVSQPLRCCSLPVNLPCGIKLYLRGPRDVIQHSHRGPSVSKVLSPPWWRYRNRQDSGLAPRELRTVNYETRRGERQFLVEIRWEPRVGRLTKEVAVEWILKDL